MAAIAGMIGLDGRPCPAASLRGALDILAPFGGDGEGTWAGRVGALGTALGAIRRARVPEDDADSQPVVVADGAVVVVADVVLTNRTELCRLLGLADRPDLADPAIVAQAYLRWGQSCCERLRGEFAFAVADRRLGGVLLGRDHTGIRPLHLHQGRGWLGFATTALAVTGLPGVPAEPDLERVKEFLAVVLVSERSWVAGVAPVPPATALWVTPDGIRRRRFWQLLTGTRRDGTAAEHAEELRAVFDEAVSARLRRRGPIGVSLSGGLDSTAVAATVAEQVAPEPVRTYTSVPPPGWRAPALARDPDESPLVRLLATRHPNLLPAFLDAAGAHVIDGDPALFSAGAPPVFATVNMTWIRAIRQRAAADGVSLLFTGQLGNLAFSRDDERWLVALLAAGRPVEAWREARAWSTAQRTPVVATLCRNVLGPLAPTWVHRCRATVRQRRRPLTAWLSASALRPEPHIDAALRRRLIATVTRTVRPTPLDSLAGVHGRAAQAEAVAAAEARYGWRYADPTSDVRLLELCLQLPAWARRHRGFDRAATRAAMAGRVPDEIRLRRVRGAQLPDWRDRLTDAYTEICSELAAAHAHPASRCLIDLARLDALVRDWPAAERAGDPTYQASHGRLLPRALAVSRYLRWFDGWARQRPTPLPPGRTTPHGSPVGVGP